MPHFTVCKDRDGLARTSLSQDLSGVVGLRAAISQFCAPLLAVRGAGELSFFFTDLRGVLLYCLAHGGASGVIGIVDDQYALLPPADAGARAALASWCAAWQSCGADPVLLQRWDASVVSGAWTGASAACDSELCLWLGSARLLGCVLALLEGWPLVVAAATAQRAARACAELLRLLLPLRWGDPCAAPAPDALLGALARIPQPQLLGATHAQLASLATGDAAVLDLEADAWYGGRAPQSLVPPAEIEAAAAALQRRRAAPAACGHYARGSGRVRGDAESELAQLACDVHAVVVAPALAAAAAAWGGATAPGAAGAYLAGRALLRCALPATACALPCLNEPDAAAGASAAADVLGATAEPAAEPGDAADIGVAVSRLLVCLIAVCRAHARHTTRAGESLLDGSTDWAAVRADAGFARACALAAGLAAGCGARLAALAAVEQSALCLNAYHALALHACVVLGPPADPLERGRWRAAAYCVDGRRWTLAQLEACVLRARGAAPAAPLACVLALAQPACEAANAWALARPPAGLDGVLSLFTASSPALRVASAGSLAASLSAALAEHVAASGALPESLRWYAEDYDGPSRLRARLRRAGVAVAAGPAHEARFAPHDWTFVVRLHPPPPLSGA